MDERDTKELESAVEGILFASGEPVRTDRICTALDIGRDQAEEILIRLRDYYTYERRGIRLLRMEDSWQLCSAPDHAEVIRKAFEIRKPAKLSQPALEALTIIAYYQPTTRAYVEKLRGVDSSYTVNMLQERGLIETCGRLQVPGRPLLYRTTEQFLRAFHLSSLDELPPLPGMDDADGNRLTGEPEQLTLPMEPTRKTSLPSMDMPSDTPSDTSTDTPSDTPPLPDIPDVPDIPDIPEIPDIPDIPDVPDIPDIPDIPEDLDALETDETDDAWGTDETGGTWETDSAWEIKRRGPGKNAWTHAPLPRRGWKKLWYRQTVRKGKHGKQHRECRKLRRKLLKKRRNTLSKHSRQRRDTSGQTEAQPSDYGQPDYAPSSNPGQPSNITRSPRFDISAGTDSPVKTDIPVKTDSPVRPDIPVRRKKSAGRWIRCLLYGCWLSWPWWWG